MRGYMFKNRWLAIVFVAMTVIGALNLVGGEDGVLVQASGDLESRRAASDASRFAPQPGYVPDPQQQQESAIFEEDGYDFSDDEELVDDAMGFDPSPDIDPGPVDSEEMDEVAILPAGEELVD